MLIDIQGVFSFEEGNIIMTGFGEDKSNTVVMKAVRRRSLGKYLAIKEKHRIFGRVGADTAREKEAQRKDQKDQNTFFH